MLGVSAEVMAAAGDGDGDGGGGGSSSAEIGGPSSGPGGGGGRGNRWPRDETLALIKIRSEMDSAFRDSTLKGPLWEEVSRKLSSLGFQRSAKKCKEKFENVYKYHKRTKGGRVAKSDGKTYRFFDQLAALENPPPPHSAAADATVSSISPTPLSVIHPNTTTATAAAAATAAIPPEILQSDSNSSSSSSSTSSDEDIQRRRKRRKWADYIGRFIKEAAEKQEALHRKFLETLENRERDRTVREEARRAQETARINREHELLVRDRSIAAAKDAALISFLQKATAAADPPPPPPPPPPQQQKPVPEPSKTDNGDNNNNHSSLPSTSTPASSRWPKAEVQALIDLRKSLDLKYQSDQGAKGPLWEEMSAAMAKLGYTRSAKRCKEKWENINKYYKKVKEANKKRSQDSKTCPYFHQLEALYNQRAGLSPITPSAQPEQPWPHQQQQIRNEEEEEEVEEEDGGEFELIPNKEASMAE
ncbi:trihelix transcription factor DF1-like [Andrographis paniculata]|uniref:trihelix transcription factor DF1-like n=1 Tax=Andrographis paniculata TaxID=175694 RepID=UPI0021E6E843|nr:trihelix transcription factor DF1-like [Andrographis paniculata]